MTESLVIFGLLSVGAIAFAVCFALFVADMAMMRIKGEAVARGHAKVEQGEWEWKE